MANMQMQYSDDDQWYEDDEDEFNAPDSVLLSLVQSYDWAGTLARIASNPEEARAVGVQGRQPLHVACDHDAPAVVVQALLKVYPEASTMVGTSNMNPLHITCSSQHASVHVIRVLLEGGINPLQSQMRDVDGDTPLHAACRCGAPIEVLDVLLQANPQAVRQRDYEGLTPLLRLWVRYFVILGDDVIDNVKGPGDLTGELGEAWRKTELLLRYAYHLQQEEAQQSVITVAGGVGSQQQHRMMHDNSGGIMSMSDDRKMMRAPRSAADIHSMFQAVHAAAAVDCPRPVVKIATIIYPRQLVEERDEKGLTPLLIAASAPIFKVRDLSDEGYLLEDRIHGDVSMDRDGANNNNNNNNQEGGGGGGLLEEDAKNAGGQQVASVIEILLERSAESACVPHPTELRLPLHLALANGKRWNQGIKHLITCYPEAVSIMDPQTKLVPFQLAAEGTQSDLSTIFEVLRTNPSLLKSPTSSAAEASKDDVPFAEQKLRPSSMS